VQAFFSLSPPLVPSQAEIKALSSYSKKLSGTVDYLIKYSGGIFIQGREELIIKPK